MSVDLDLPLLQSSRLNFPRNLQYFETVIAASAANLAPVKMDGKKERSLDGWATADCRIEVPCAELVPTVLGFEPGTSGFQSEDDTTTQKGLTRKCGRITSATTYLPLLKRGDLYGVIPSTTVLWPVHNPVPF